MTARSGRVFALTTVLVLLACGTQALAPREVKPSPSPTVSASPTNASTDVVYVRKQGSSGAASIVAIDARTGATLRELPDGVASPDRSKLYWAESVAGATEAVIHVTDFATGQEQRSMKIAGPYHTLYADNAPAGLTADGQLLAVWGGEPYKLNDEWVTRFAVVDLRSGTLASSVEFKDRYAYGYVGLSPDGTRLYLTQYGDGATQLRAYDLHAKTFSAIQGLDWDGRQIGFRGAPITSTDGRWTFSLYAGASGASTFVLGLNLATGRAFRVLLPDQRTDDWEKQLLWSLALTADGKTLYALNTGLGVVNEIDIPSAALRRTARAAARPDAGAIAALGQLFFPIAEAKRYLRGGALLSPDGRMVYAVGQKGLVLVDTTTLVARDTWQPDQTFESLAISPDGARLYAISDESSRVAIIDARNGTSAGALRLSGWAQSIVRVDLGR